MEEAKKAGTTGTSPASISTAPANSPPPTVIPGSGGSQVATPTKRRQRLSGDQERNPTGPKSRVRKDANELKFEAIRILSNIEGGRFFLLYEDSTGKKEVISCWN